MQSCSYLVDNLANYGVKVTITFCRENDKPRYNILGLYPFGVSNRTLFCFSSENEDEKTPILYLDTLKEMDLTFDATVQLINLIDSLKCYCMDFWGV